MALETVSPQLDTHWIYTFLQNIQLKAPEQQYGIIYSAWDIISQAYLPQVKFRLAESIHVPVAGSCRFNAIQQTELVCAI